MTSWNEIEKMNSEELAAENKKLVRRLITRNIVIPVLTAVVAHVAANILVKKLDDSDTED